MVNRILSVATIGFLGLVNCDPRKDLEKTCRDQAKIYLEQKGYYKPNRLDFTQCVYFIPDLKYGLETCFQNEGIQVTCYFKNEDSDKNLGLDEAIDNCKEESLPQITCEEN